ncbi:hypothetical protein SAMN05216323_101914 [Williamwhitmania taraxaci]|uniref:Uncharacterized protein n=1 Tax=Williamwhitmania taraxaci TaxID=1640674 RepID=A0A1G6J961_9BACT|nr:hypothetical protein SAMN05216323_101914 [Williamwhitmania taraxaci]
MHENAKVKKFIATGQPENGTNRLQDINNSMIHLGKKDVIVRL